MILKLGLISAALICVYVNCQTVVQDANLDNKEVRCLVCSASVKELTLAVKSTDKSQTVKIGGHRLDPQGNYNAPKTIPLSQSEIYLSELIDSICDKMEDYARGIWKSNGTLTILKMVVDGKMNPHMDDIDFVQDEDLNKSLKYYCESVMEEYEEDIIKHYQNGENLDEKYCAENSNICLPHKPDTLKKEL